MKASQLSPLVAQFKAEVHDKGEEIDPEDEYCWLSLAVGWAIAKGLSPIQSREFATYIRYSTNLG